MRSEAAEAKMSLLHEESTAFCFCAFVHLCICVLQKKMNLIEAYLVLRLQVGAPASHGSFFLPEIGEERAPRQESDCQGLGNEEVSKDWESLQSYQGKPGKVHSFNRTQNKVPILMKDVSGWSCCCESGGGGGW